MSLYKERQREQSTLRLADKFDVAAEDAKRFGNWHKGLSIAKEGFAFAAGTGVLIGTGGAAVVPALAAAAVTSVAGRVAINHLLPRAFSRTR